IRGDLSYLEQQGYLKRSFGGAIATPLSSEPEAIQPIAPLSLAQQMEIARHCARLIRDRDTLFLGHGTICRKIIPLLSEVKKLRLITNDPEHALLANQFIDGEIILAGSEMLRPD
ncbi:DeoR family transcriptional regulator, partial [Escherichia coli]|nr:DeoR family transcriptional regulator [Escherichia coli]